MWVRILNLQQLKIVSAQLSFGFRRWVFVFFETIEVKERIGESQSGSPERAFVEWSLVLGCVSCFEVKAESSPTVRTRGNSNTFIFREGVLKYVRARRNDRIAEDSRFDGT